MYKNYKELLAIQNNVKKIFFYRICGTGMGACATLIKEMGYDVVGADSDFYPPMSDYLNSSSIKCLKMNDLTDDYLKTFDLIVVGNVVARNSDDAKKIESLGVSYCSFPAVLGAFVLSKKDVVGICGTHGKTTTTYYFSQMAKNLGIDAGHFIGGVIDDNPPGKLGSSKYFFIESDEYDSAYFEKWSKFRSYCLDHMILTSLEYDHADIFENVEQIEEQFVQAMPEIKGQWIGNAAYPSVKKVFQKYFGSKKCSFYGLDELGPRIIKTQKNGSEFEIIINGQREFYRTNIIGKHNVENLTTCLIFFRNEGFKSEELQKAILSLHHVKRRQEERGYYKGALVIDDFAHHPRAVHETLAAVKAKNPELKMIIFLEPKSATARSNIFQNEFATSMRGADGVYIIDPLRPTSVKNSSNLDPQKIVDDWQREHRGPSGVVKNLADLRIALDQVAAKGVAIVFMSNSSCMGLWQSEFVHELN